MPGGFETVVREELKHLANVTDHVFWMVRNIDNLA